MSFGLYESIHNVLFAEFIIFEYPNGVGALFIAQAKQGKPWKKKNVILITIWKCCKLRPDFTSTPPPSVVSKRRYGTHQVRTLCVFYSINLCRISELLSPANAVECQIQKFFRNPFLEFEES